MAATETLDKKGAIWIINTALERGGSEGAIAAGHLLARLYRAQPAPSQLAKAKEPSPAKWDESKDAFAAGQLLAKSFKTQPTRLQLAETEEPLLTFEEE